MTYDLTSALEIKRRNEYAAAVRQACKEITACPDPQKRWEALRVLRVLQDRIKGGAA